MRIICDVSFLPPNTHPNTQYLGSQSRGLLALLGVCMVWGYKVQNKAMPPKKYFFGSQNLFLGMWGEMGGMIPNHFLEEKPTTFFYLCFFAKSFFFWSCWGNKQQSYGLTPPPWSLDPPLQCHPSKLQIPKDPPKGESQSWTIDSPLLGWYSAFHKFSRATLSGGLYTTLVGWP